MARHETEMHRQRRELLEALRVLLFCLDSPTEEVQRAAALFRPAIEQARVVVKAVTPKCNIGMFQDERQLDFADRTDLKR